MGYLRTVNDTNKYEFITPTISGISWDILLPDQATIWDTVEVGGHGKRDTWWFTEENHKWLRSPRMYRLN